MTSISQAKALFHKLIEEASVQDVERACEGARPPNKMRKQADMTSKGLAMALVLKLIEDASRHDLERDANALVRKLIDEPSGPDLERSRKGARPPH